MYFTHVHRKIKAKYESQVVHVGLVILTSKYLFLTGSYVLYELLEVNWDRIFIMVYLLLQLRKFYFKSCLPYFGVWQIWKDRLPRGLSSRAFTPDVGDPVWDRPKSLKQVVTAPLLNARQQMWVSWVLGDDHYKGLAHVTVGVAC